MLLNVERQIPIGISRKLLLNVVRPTLLLVVLKLLKNLNLANPKVKVKEASLSLANLLENLKAREANVLRGLVNKLVTIKQKNYTH
jgi:hypothetical protein